MNALLHNNGSNNTAVGYGALTNSTGSNSIALGTNAGSDVTTANNVICIGITGQNVSDSFYVGNVFETSIDADNLPVRIDFRGRLGTQTSSRRFKDHITPMDKASEAILALNPVKFHYKDDTRRRPEFGLIAEEVAQVDPNLVALDKEGKPYTVRYDQVNAMLLNEFLKEHKAFLEAQRKVQEEQIKIEKQDRTITELRSMVAEQQKGMQALTAQVREQAAQIQKVNAQIELNEPAPLMVFSHR